MRLLVLGLPLVFLVGTFAGCIGGGSSASNDETGGEDPCLPEDPLCDAGPVQTGSDKGGAIIDGFVADETFKPIVGARVVIEELDLSLITDDTGQFAFTGISAGTYSVRAERIGFNPSKRSVVAADSGTFTVEFTLKAIPKEVAYHHPEHHSGFWECNTHEVNCGEPFQAAGGGGQSNDQFQWSIPVDRKLATFVVEVVWTPETSPFADRLEVTLRDEKSQGDTNLAFAKGASPLVARVELADLEAAALTEGGAISIRVDVAPTQGQEPSAGVGFGFAFAQNFDVYVTPFYLDPAPEDYSPAADCAEQACA